MATTYVNAFTRIAGVLLLFAEVAQAGPEQAVVRIPSHGGSGTIIATTARHTYVLSCAHAFQGEDFHKPIKLDGEAIPPGISNLLAVDYEHDLSLIEIVGGNAPNVAPVAGPGHKPSSHLLSVGYDEMRLPATRRTAHILKVDSDITWTMEPPWHGRSGGVLLDLDNGTVIGVVSGYVSYPAGPGIYVSHRDIGVFLEQHAWSSPAGSMNSQSPPSFSFPDPRPPMTPGYPAPARPQPFLCQPQPFFSQPMPFFGPPRACPGGH